MMDPDTFQVGDVYWDTENGPGKGDRYDIVARDLISGIIFVSKNYETPQKVTPDFLAPFMHIENRSYNFSRYGFPPVLLEYVKTLPTCGAEGMDGHPICNQPSTLGPPPDEHLKFHGNDERTFCDRHTRNFHGRDEHVDLPQAKLLRWMKVHNLNGENRDDED